MLASRDSELEEIIDAYEARRATSSDVCVDEFLPRPDHPRFADVAIELLRVDLEYAWQSGERNLLERYFNRYPDILAKQDRLAPLAFEEYRLRCHDKEQVDKADYATRWQIDVSAWPELRHQGGQPSASWLAHLERRESASRVVAEGKRDRFPAIGDVRAGFRFVAEIGRGSFSRVYLAQQDSLANRLVVLKVSSQHWAESDLLARLQHTNIVPIYSVHRDDSQQLVCMPFFGCCTLADVLRKLFGSSNGSSVVPRSGAALLSTVADRAAETLTDPQIASVTPVLSAQDLNPRMSQIARRNALERLRECSYVEACLWMVSEISAGLAHAHHLGIVHRDLKPANILITDDGRPMLLDFNLSADDNDQSSRNDDIGGTLPYMAPEHLQALIGEGRPDARSDIFSIGVVLYELLTGARPFTDPQSHVEEVVAALVAERRELTRHCLAQRLAAANAFVSPALHSILYRCLAPDPHARYQSADHLQEDLRRQLDHQPLRYAPDSSIRERLKKWTRRHPRLVSASGVSVIAAGLLMVLTSAWLARGVHVAHLSAQQQWNEFQVGYQAARLSLRQPDVQPATLAQGVVAAREHYHIYATSDSAALDANDGYRQLSSQQQDTLRRQLSELAFLLASAETRLARSMDSPEVQRETLVEARNWNSRASLLGSVRWPALRWQSEELEALLSGRSPTVTTALVAAHADSDDFWQLYTSGVTHYDQGRYRNAVDSLSQAIELQPQDFAAWFALGNAQSALARWNDALASFTACNALRPETWVGLYHRSLVKFETRDFDGAEHDCDLALQLAPDESVLLLNRAIARQQQGRFVEAERDLNRVLAAPHPIARAYFIRSAVRAKQGNTTGSQADRTTGLETTPTDLQSWLARGMAWLPSDVDHAVQDLRKALGLNPRSISALRNLAYVYSETAHTDLELAIALLTTAIESRSEDADLLASRGVLRARHRQFAEARQDASRALALDALPQTLIHAACIYALTAVEQPLDLDRAATLVQQALQREPQWLSVVRQDVDLKSLHDHPRFRAAIQAAERFSQSHDSLETLE